MHRGRAAVGHSQLGCQSVLISYGPSMTPVESGFTRGPAAGCARPDANRSPMGPGGVSPAPWGAALAAYYLPDIALA